MGSEMCIRDRSLPESMMDDIYDSTPDDQNNREALASKYFSFDKEFTMPMMDVQRVYYKHHDKFSLEKTTFEYKHFKGHLELAFGIRFKKVTKNGVRTMAAIGMKLSTDMDRGE